MRSSSKSRSRHKNNNHNNNNNNNRRSNTNVVNRVFDSSGPEGKVRGTPQQIVDKYQGLARDAQLNGDRVAAESYLQHSEHYSRLLGVAMREQAVRREQHEAQQNQRRDNQQDHQPQQNQQQQQQSQNQQPNPASNAHNESQPEVNAPPAASVEVQTEGESGLVVTPENTQPKKRKPRPKAPKAEVAEVAEVKTAEPAADTTPDTKQSAAE